MTELEYMKQEDGFLGIQESYANSGDKAKAVIVPSLWEDPGFVMVEAAFNLTPLIVSDCPSGPKEFIDKDKNGKYI